MLWLKRAIPPFSHTPPKKKEKVKRGKKEKDQPGVFSFSYTTISTNFHVYILPSVDIFKYVTYTMTIKLGVRGKE